MDGAVGARTPSASPPPLPPSSVLVCPAHWGGRTHQLQLLAVVRALAARGHAVTYVTSTAEPSSHRANLKGVEIIVAEGVVWPPDLDLTLAVRMARGEAEVDVRRQLVRASCDAAASFFADERIQALLARSFDVAVVDADSLAGHTLVDALYPLPHAHFLTYPYRRSTTASLKTQMLESSELQLVGGNRLNELRARLGAPPKAVCAACHVLTIVGHSRALHAPPAPPASSLLRSTDEASRAPSPPPTPPSRASLPSIEESLAASQLACGPPEICCTGSVGSGVPAAESDAPLQRELLSWADAASEGFVLVALGSWGDRACTHLGKDPEVFTALRTLGCACIWKTASAPSTPAAAPPHSVRFEPWLPQLALLAHRNCRLLVCHGGANSISEALSCGVPVVCLPIAWDQPVNAAMVTTDELGVGWSLPLASLTSASLHATLRAALGDGHVALRAQHISREMRRLDSGAVGAATLVERVVSTFDGEMRKHAAMAIRAPPPVAAPADATDRVRGDAPIGAADESVAGWGDDLN